MEGIGFGILIGIVLTSLKGVIRPMAKGAIKLGLTTSVRVRDALHEGKETLTDLFAEAKQEIAVEAAPGGVAAVRAKPAPSTTH